MKNILLTFCILLVFEETYGQTISIKDMINKTTCKSYSCFNDWIITKGFSYTSVKNIGIGGGKQYIYSSDETFTITSNKSLVTTNIASIDFYLDGTGVSFGTAVKNHYLKLFSELKFLKFIARQTEDEENGTIAVTYTSSQYPKVFVSIRTMISRGQGPNSSTYYDIIVGRNK